MADSLDSRRHTLQIAARSLSTILIAVLVVAAIAVWRDPLRWRLAAQDFFVLANHQPSAQEKQWSVDLKLTEDGQDVLYASQAELVSPDNFGDACPTKEETNVLGCYLTSSKIYVLDVNVEEIEEVEEVTLAHEILHGVWDRLPQTERDQLEAQLLNYFRELDDDSLNQLIAGYRNSAPTGQADDVTATELHSILATEYRNLPQALENHYRRYFNDRSLVVDLYRSYEDQFETRQRRAEEISTQLDQLSSEISAKNSEIDQQIKRNQALIAEIERLRKQGKVEESNELVPVQNQLVDQINSNIVQYNDMIERFNSLRRSYQQLSLELNKLYESLDTRSPVQ